MPHKAPGKYYRKGLSWMDITKMFPNEETAEHWFAQTRWPNGPVCPECQSTHVQSGAKHKTMPYRCRSCRVRFSVKTGTVMQGSKLDLQVWAIAIYILTTGIKGTSSMKLHRDLKITQKTAWYLAHRIRETWDNKQPMQGSIEVDETFIGGKEANRHASKKSLGGRWLAGKYAVVGMKSRDTKAVTAQVIAPVSSVTLQRFVTKYTNDGNKVYSDQNPGYLGLRKHGYTLEQVNHSVKEYVNGQAHTNGIESFWAGLKRGYYGTYHKMSGKQLQRYVNEFAGRQTCRDLDTLAQMQMIVQGMTGKRLQYQELVAS